MANKHAHHHHILNTTCNPCKCPHMPTPCLANPAVILIWIPLHEWIPNLASNSFYPIFLQWYSWKIINSESLSGFVRVILLGISYSLLVFPATVFLSGFYTFNIFLRFLLICVIIYYMCVCVWGGVQKKDSLKFREGPFFCKIGAWLWKGELLYRPLMFFQQGRGYWHFHHGLGNPF